MEFIGGIFTEVFLKPIINLLLLSHHFLDLASIPGALGFSILILTLIIRFAVWPMMSAQLKSAKKLADLKPHMDELKKKHKGDKQALAQAQMALYKEHGVNPAGGCLPALIQLPVFIALYQAIINVFPGPGGNLDYLNSLLYFPWLKLTSFPDASFLGLNISVKPWDVLSSQPLIILVPAVTALLTFVQSKMTIPKPIAHHKNEPAKETKQKENMEDTMSAVQSQMVFLMPIMVGWFSFTFPIGLAIYWNTYTILGIIHQYRISGWGGFEDYARKLKRNTR